MPPQMNKKRRTRQSRGKHGDSANLAASGRPVIPTTTSRSAVHPDPNHTAGTGINTPPRAEFTIAEGQTSQRASPKTDQEGESAAAGEGSIRDNEGFIGDDERSIIGHEGSIEDDEKEIRICRRVVSDLTGLMDDFAASYQGDEQRDQRRTARELIRILGQHLNTMVWVDTNGAVTAPVKPASTTEEEVSDEDRNGAQHP